MTEIYLSVRKHAKAKDQQYGNNAIKIINHSENYATKYLSGALVYNKVFKFLLKFYLNFITAFL